MKNFKPIIIMIILIMVIITGLLILFVTGTINKQQLVVSSTAISMAWLIIISIISRVMVDDYINKLHDSKESPHYMNKKFYNEKKFEGDRDLLNEYSSI